MTTPNGEAYTNGVGHTNGEAHPDEDPLQYEMVGVDFIHPSYDEFADIFDVPNLGIPFLTHLRILQNAYEEANNVTNEIAALAPRVSRHLNTVGDNWDGIPAADQLQDLIVRIDDVFMQLHDRISGVINSINVFLDRQEQLHNVTQGGI